MARLETSRGAVQPQLGARRAMHVQLFGDSVMTSVALFKELSDVDVCVNMIIFYYPKRRHSQIWIHDLHLCGAETESGNCKQINLSNVFKTAPLCMCTCVAGYILLTLYVVQKT